VKNEFTTDIATFCIFDLSSLEDRLNDVDDWWCTPWDEVEAVNSGNVIFVGLGADGNYGLSITDNIDKPDISLKLKVPSGKIFLGAADETTGGGLSPEGYRGGGFLSMPVGNYAVSFSLSNGELLVSMTLGGDGINSIKEPISLGH
jgi:Family of unknown function (DUF6386)